MLTTLRTQWINVECEAPMGSGQMSGIVHCPECGKHVNTLPEQWNGSLTVFCKCGAGFDLHRTVRELRNGVFRIEAAIVLMKRDAGVGRVA